MPTTKKQKRKSKPLPPSTRQVVYLAYRHVLAIARTIRAVLASPRHLPLMTATVDMLGELRDELELLEMVSKAKDDAGKIGKGWRMVHRKKGAPALLDRRHLGDPP